MRYENRHFQNEDVKLCGNEFHNCTFDHCNLIFDGDGLLGMDGTSITNCRYVFAGAAAGTLDFLSALYAIGEKKFIEGTFENIRNGNRPQTDSRLTGEDGSVH